MDPSDETQFFRFLDLPPELRDAIYGFYFKFERSQRINILQWKTNMESSGPDSAITAVCRKIRSESFALHKLNSSKYWRENEWVIGISPKWDFPKEAALLDQCIQTLPSNAHPTTLRFFSEWGWTEGHIFDACALECGQVEWTYRYVDDDGEQGEFKGSTFWLFREIAEMGLRLYAADNPALLDIANCLEAFMEAFVNYAYD